MEPGRDNYGIGLLERLRNRGFWAYFICVASSVFVLLTFVDLALPYIYEQDQPGSSLDFVANTGINIAIGLLSAGIAWKYNGKPWINRSDTIKLDLDK